MSRGACPDVESLAAFVGHGLAGEVRRSIEAHFDDCDACRRIVATLVRMEPSRVAPLPRNDATTSLALPGVLAGRYEIVRFIAAGGMGQVYEAHDRVLGVRVALKTLRPELAADERAIERFRREVLLARDVTHPNVCRIYDVGVAGVTVFLTMELLSGETLQARLRREGAMPEREVLPLARQMADALAAAHARSIVHRDFKSGNVILTRDGPEQPLRAVVTDFGLARSVSPADSDATATGAIVGTPAYMAPEQVEGGEVGAPADVYAFGVVLYEMLTGRLPFEGDTPLAMAARRLSSPPPSPRQVVPSLDRRWEEAILGCLARRPGDRFADPRAALALLGGGRRRRRFVSAAIAVALAFGAVLGAIVFREEAPKAPAAAVKANKANPRVAVFGLKNLNGRADVAWVSTAVAELLSAEVAAGEAVSSISGEVIHRVRQELSLSDAESFAGETLQRIRHNLGADLVVTGSYLAAGGPDGPLRLVVRFQDCRSGETVETVPVSTRLEELAGSVAGIATRLRQRLGVAEPANRPTRGALPAQPEAARLYTEGLQRLRHREAPKARDLFQRALALESHPLVHRALSEAWETLGYTGKAEQEAKRAHESSAGLPPQERLLIEARYRILSRNVARGIELHKELSRRAPDNLDYAYALVRELARSGRAHEALAVLAEIPLERRAADPRITIYEAGVYQHVGDFEKMAATARIAAQQAEAIGARILWAKARGEEAGALQFLGREAEALAAAKAAVTVYEQVDEPRGLSLAFGNIGGVHLTSGRGRAAAKWFGRAAAVYRRLGVRAGAPFSNLAEALLMTGDLRGAEDAAEEALAHSTDTDSQTMITLSTSLLGRIATLRGDLKKGRRALERALQRARDRNARHLALEAHQRLADLFRLGDERGPAEAHLAAAEALLEHVKIVPLAIEVAWLRAALALEHGELALAEAHVRRAAEKSRGVAADLEVRVAALHVRIALAQGQVERAREIVAGAAAVSTRHESHVAAQEFELVRARLRGHGASPAEQRAALAAVEKVVAGEAKGGHRGIGLLAALDRARLLAELGQAERARRALTEVEREAKESGHLLFARLAREARR